GCGPGPGGTDWDVWASSTPFAASSPTPGIAAAEHAHAAHGQDDLAVLSQSFVTEVNHAAVGPRGGTARLQHLDARAKPIAGAHRLQPAHFVDPGRPHARPRRDEAVPQNAHHDAAGHPPARDQAAVDRGAGGVLVEMERLGVIAARELHDFLAGDEVVPDLEDLPRAIVLEVTILYRHRCGH